MTEKAAKSTAPYYAPGEGSECVPPAEQPEGEGQAVKGTPKDEPPPKLTASVQQDPAKKAAEVKKAADEKEQLAKDEAKAQAEMTKNLQPHKK
jgi:hypothetical protein